MQVELMKAGVAQFYFMQGLPSTWFFTFAFTCFRDGVIPDSRKLWISAKRHIGVTKACVDEVEIQRYLNSRDSEYYATN